MQALLTRGKVVTLFLGLLLVVQGLVLNHFSTLAYAADASYVPSPAEQRVLDEIAAGRTAAFSPTAPEAERTLSAKFLEILLLLQRQLRG